MGLLRVNLARREYSNALSLALVGENDFQFHLVCVDYEV